MHLSKPTRILIWAILSLFLAALVALGVNARNSAKGLQVVDSAKIAWPKDQDKLTLPGQPRPLRFILWSDGPQSQQACEHAAVATNSHILKRFRHASARRMHLSKKKGHEFLLADSEKILHFYANRKVQTKSKDIVWASLHAKTTQSIQVALAKQDLQLHDSCLFLIVDEVNVLQSSIVIPNNSWSALKRERGLVQRAISRSIHQWSTFRFLADVPMLRKQLTDPTYRRRNKLN